MSETTENTISVPTFTIHINYNLSQSGQKTSLRQGGSGKAQQCLSGQITLDEYEKSLEPLGWKLSDNGNGIINGSSTISLNTGTQIAHGLDAWITGNLSHSSITSSAFQQLEYDKPPTFESLYADYLEIKSGQRAIIDQILAARKTINEAEERKAQQKKAEKEAAQSLIIDAFLADPTARVEGEAYFSANIGDAKIEHSHPRWSELKEEIQKRQASDKKAKEAEDAAREAQKNTQIAEWVAQFGTDSQRERFAENLLDRAEALKAMEEQAFASAVDAGFRTFEKIRKGEVRATCSDNCTCNNGHGDKCSVKFYAEDADSLTEEQFARLKELRQILPGVSATPRYHSGYCDGEDGCELPHGQLVRHGLYAKVVVGALTFSREFAL